MDHSIQAHAFIMASSIKYSKKKMDEQTKKKSLTTTIKRHVEIDELLIQETALIQKNWTGTFL